MDDARRNLKKRKVGGWDGSVIAHIDHAGKIPAKGRRPHLSSGGVLEEAVRRS